MPSLNRSQYNFDMRKLFDREISKSTFMRSINVLSKSDQKRIILVICIQVSMGLIDLLGVAIIGVLGALAVSGVQSAQPGNRVNWILVNLHLSDKSFQQQVAFLGIAATTILVSRTLFSVVFTRRILFFLSRRAAVISTNLISRLLAQPLLKIQERTFQDSIFAITSGVNSITLGVIGSTVILISDTSLLLIMTAGLFIVDPLIAFSSILVFSGIGLVIYRLMHTRAESLGREESRLSIKSNEKILEVLEAYRESVVRNRRDYYVREIGKLRFRSSNVLAELSFMPNISKYVIESTVVLGALAISGVQFATQDAPHAIAILAVFLAAGTRIAPAVLRVQQGALQIRSSLGVATPTLGLISDLENVYPMETVNDNPNTDHYNFDGSIFLDNVSLTYPGNLHQSLINVNLDIPAGCSVALVGPSGAGKTSIVDVILGVIVPTEGAVVLSGVSPVKCTQIWPGAIGYVPQDVSIINGTIRENVALGFPSETATDQMVFDAVKSAHLSELVSSYPKGLDTQVGERGNKISGGQRQRLGIARAMFTKPKLLVLDEATSALDGESESIISNTITGLRGQVTVLMIAHRLSTVRNADLVVYLDGGRVKAQGTFQEVRSQVPDFDRQAKLMGL
jgi:ABC-type multidrug transport system fused ATPase/permease subunit